MNKVFEYESSLCHLVSTSAFLCYLLSEILATAEKRCHRRDYYDSLAQPQWVLASTKPQSIPPTKPLPGRPTWYRRSHVALIIGWSIITEQYRVCLSKCSFSASQAPSLLNFPLLNWNKPSHCHPLESITSFIHPIPFFSTLLLIVSMIIFWVVLMIIALNMVWYASWHCIKQINPLRLPVKKVLDMGSTNSNGMFNIAVYLE